MAKPKYVFVNDKRFDTFEDGQDYIHELMNLQLANRPDDKTVSVNINRRKIKNAKSLYLDVDFELVDKKD
tara:strand:- start:38 stop:247 length:210 start_codon:yes stop_codon:yes gene_type:complete